MKRTLILLFLCLGCGGMVLHSQYRISYYQGTVECKKGNSWIAALNGLGLSDGDSIRISKGGSLKIKDLQSGLTYNQKNFSGETTVYAYVDGDRENRFGQVVRRTNKEINTGNSQPAVRPVKKGGTARASLTENGEELEQLADMFAWIGGQACSGKESPKLNGLTFKRYKFGDELDFIFDNRTDKDYYMNVLHINKQTGFVSLCYVVNPEQSGDACPITQAGTHSCNIDPFFPDTEDDVYVLIATEMPFDTYAVDARLAWHSAFEAKGSNMNVKYMW